jgi:hypothetical protein
MDGMKSMSAGGGDRAAGRTEPIHDPSCRRLSVSGDYIFPDTNCSCGAGNEDEAFRLWLVRQIQACARRAQGDRSKRSRDYHGQSMWLLKGILAEYDRREATR